MEGEGERRRGGVPAAEWERVGGWAGCAQSCGAGVWGSR